MAGLSDIGSREYALRGSGIPQLMHCSMRGFLGFMKEQEAAGSAANTGTLCHRGVQVWHETGDVEQAKRAILDARRKFQGPPEKAGDDSTASRWVQAYAEDGRNAPLGAEPADWSGGGKVVAVEHEFAIRIPPAEHDPTGVPIHITGHIDQVREDRGQNLNVWDVKTGKESDSNGRGALLAAMYQLAIYAKGAETVFGRPVGIGGVIWPLGYTARKASRKEVFYPGEVRYADLEYLVEAVVDQIGFMRQGIVVPNISRECNRCYIASGPGDCLRQFRKIVGAS